MGTTQKREPTLWDLPDTEIIHGWATKDEAIGELLGDTEEVLDTMVICGYARMAPDFGHYGPLEDVLMRLDEEYGNPDDYTEANEAMKDAEKAFIAVIEKEYEVWACEEVCRETVNVRQWMDEHPEIVSKWTKMCPKCYGVSPFASEKCSVCGADFKSKEE